MENDRREKIEICGMWEKENDRGTYYQGKIGPNLVLGYFITQKKNPKSPDLKIYVVPVNDAEEHEWTVRTEEWKQERLRAMSSGPAKRGGGDRVPF